MKESFSQHPDSIRILLRAKPPLAAIVWAVLDKLNNFFKSVLLLAATAMFASEVARI